MKKSILLRIPFIIGAVALGAFLFSGLVMLLWNNILPAVFHIGTITLWQAAGLLLLSKILFGGFGRRHKGWHRHKHKMGGPWGRAQCADRQQAAG